MMKTSGTEMPTDSGNGEASILLLTGGFRARTPYLARSPTEAAKMKRVIGIDCRKCIELLCRRRKQDLNCAKCMCHCRSMNELSFTLSETRSAMEQLEIQ